jgi:soluble lytic murein transglycosylase-like protein
VKVHPPAAKRPMTQKERESGLKGPAAQFADKSAGLQALSSSPSPIIQPRSYLEGPRLDLGKERALAFAANLPGYISIAPNPKAKEKAYAYVWWARPSKEEVTTNTPLIDRTAKRYGIDPDLLKALVWFESTHGYYDAYTGVIRAPKSLRPMNVNVRVWSDILGVDRKSLANVETNIETGAYIFSQILSRLIDPTPEKVFTLYNNLRADEVSPYGETAAQYWRDRPWAK